MNTIWIHNRKSPKREEASFKKLPKLNREAFAKLISQPNVRVITDDSVSAAFSQHRRNAKVNLTDLKKKLGRDSQLYKEIIKMPAVENPSTTVSTTGADRKFALINRDAIIFDLLRNSAVTNSRLNQYRLYRAIYENITDNADLSAPLLADFNALLKPGKVRLLDGNALQAEIANLVQFCAKTPFRVTYNPTAKPTQCGNEIGTGQGGDSCGNIAATPAANGLLQNADWALKNFTTCVRDQGSPRGTCVGFATVGAVESAIAVHHNQFVNLSEQDLYRHFKLDWYPFPSDYYGDGYSGLTALLVSIANQYIFPYEKDWDYNPSHNRNEDDAARDYDYSCVANGSCAPIGNCSNTNHQARRICYQVDEEVVREVVKTVSRWIGGIADVVDTVAGWFGFDTEPAGRWVEEQVTELITEIMTIQVCVYDDSELPTTSRFYIPFGVPVFDALSTPLGRDSGLELAKLFLACRIPIIFGFRVVDSFRNPSNGYVTYNPNEKPGGGHAVLMTGFVTNSDLPNGAPQGAGGGYFIIKNSWGTDSGDCGYYYLPYEWVKKWGKSLVGVPYVGQR